ncbi:nuclease [Streptomyces sp. NPDC005828]|uniref:nuclease n=1 Tax=Streptomyces sp. NPDC005828 TaxID=3157071 RepID=UPI0033F526A9
MPMLLIKGSFHLSGHTAPDGDTVPFIPDYVGEWKLVRGCEKPQPERDGHVDIRLEGIDALETHYTGNYGDEERQPAKFGDEATNALLTFLGFRDIQRTPDPHHPHDMISATPESVPGFILTNGADVFGRCVAFACVGDPPGASGYELDVSVKLLKERTANYHLLSLGLAYPTFYQGLLPVLRDALADGKAEAQAGIGVGIWNTTADAFGDVTLTGAKITGMQSITDDVVILPKLFRRLKEYFSLGNTTLDAFPAYLAGAADKFLDLTQAKPKEQIGLHRIVEITDTNTVRMTLPPEKILFKPK